jgi:hypothetical protein
MRAHELNPSKMPWLDFLRRRQRGRESSSRPHLLHAPSKGVFGPAWIGPRSAGFGAGHVGLRDVTIVSFAEKLGRPSLAVLGGRFDSIEDGVQARGHLDARGATALMRHAA